MAVDEETLRENIENPEARYAWRIPQARTYAGVAAVVHILALVAMTAVLIAYFVTGSTEMLGNRISGLIIVVLMVYAISVMRVFQIRAEISDLEGFANELKRSFDGRDEHDLAAQVAVEETYLWPSRHFSVVAKMAGFTAFAVVIINTYQLGSVDILRTVVFDLGILAYLAGSLWNNFTFKAALLETELKERMRASLEFRERCPEEYAAQYHEDDGYTDDDIDYSAVPKDDMRRSDAQGRQDDEH